MHKIVVNDMTIDIVRKDIKNLHLGVYPPHGRIRVAVPLQLDDEAVRLAVLARLPWIKRQQRKFKGQARQSPREFVSGESHYFQGNRYLLDVIYEDASPRVTIPNKTRINLYVRPGSDTAQRARVLYRWYRTELKALIPPLLEKWEPVIGVQVDDWGVRHMKTKWGSCNIEARRIWLNLELIKKPPQCLEYIVVHELVHLLERHHNDRFSGLMDRYLPNWRSVRDELNREPLAHEEWEY